MGRVKLGIFVGAGLLVALLLAFLVSPEASRKPDGLEKVAIDKGFNGTADQHPLAGGPLADYGVEGVHDERLSTGVAGVIGVAVCFALGAGLFGLVRLKGRRRSGAAAPSS